MKRLIKYFCRKLKESVWMQVVVLVITLIPSFLTLLRPGYFPMQDDQQAFRINQMAKCFADRQFPCRWVPDGGYGYGYPMFNFYPPSLYYAGAILNLVGVQALDSVKFLFILSFVVSGLMMFFLLREFFGGWAGYVGSFLYVYAPFRAVEVYVRGALSETWALALFPFLFLFGYRAVKHGARWDFVWLGIGIGFLLTTHIPMSVIFLPILALWIVFLMAHFRRLGRTFKFLASLALGVGLAAFFIVPAIMEKQYVHVETLVEGYFDYRQHFVSFGRFLLSNRWGYGSSNLGQTENLSLSTGIVQWVAGLVAMVVVVTLARGRRFLIALAIFLGGIELGVLFMIHQRSAFIWERISFLAYLQFPWRFLGPSTFLLSFLAAMGMFLCRNKRIALAYTALIGLAVVLLYGNFFRPKSWLNISDKDKFSGALWQSQLTSSIFDYLPIYAKLPPASSAPAFPEILSGKGIVGNYRKGSDFQTGTVIGQTSLEIRVPLYDFPGMVVYVNGLAVPHFHDDCRGESYCLGLISFWIPRPGENRVTVRLEDSPVRLFSNALSVVSLLSVLLAAFFYKFAQSRFVWKRGQA